MINDALYTQRNINNSWYIFIGGLLGSVFGIVGTYATFMAFVEGFAEKIKRKLKQREKFQIISKKRQNILELFEVGPIQQTTKPRDDMTTVVPISNE